LAVPFRAMMAFLAAALLLIKDFLRVAIELISFCVMSFDFLLQLPTPLLLREPYLA
jgi:hypothetical protein